MILYADLDNQRVGGACKARDFPAQIALLKRLLE